VVVPLWEKGAPGFENLKDEKEHRNVQKSGEYNVTNVHNPTLTVFLPPKDKATGAAVVIAPGGGHRELWVLHEGEYLAKWLNDRGVAAFVLHYRLAREHGSKYQIAEHALQDGQLAVRLVRSRAKEWGVNPARVGMMGFSAGGEVVAMVCGHSQESEVRNQGSAPGKASPVASAQGKASPVASAPGDDPVDRESCRPDFQALIYSGPLGIVRQPVAKETPPTFILVGDDDKAATWLVEHYQALKKVGVSCELHVYAKTPHGFGYRPTRTNRPVDAWPQRFYEFLDAEGMLKK
jgi:endo-1,4-beta-xylanase